MTTVSMPTYFLCHGGGPWPWLDGPFRRVLSRLEQGLQAVPAQLPARPAAILVISAHWEERDFTATASDAPGMVYDYAGFPPETYSIRYSSPGSPALAGQVVTLLRSAGFDARTSQTRGYDHGTYSVPQTMFPAADIPVVQMSLRASLDPDDHLRAGAALAGLRDESVLIIGSGMSCRERGPDMATASPPFDTWLHDALAQAAPQRAKAFRGWEKAPFAREVHPREEHLLPLMVAAGAALDEPATRIYGERLMGRIAVSSYRFGH